MENDKINPSVVILGSYFSKESHPQFPEPHLEGVGSDGRAIQNDIVYIQKWYNSIKELNINAVIFYDNLTDKFVETYTTDKIRFIYAESQSYIYNVWRFFCFRTFLQNNKFDIVFFTDSSDVTVIQNPVTLIKSFPDIDFFVGKDSIKLHEFPYLKFHQHFQWENYFDFFLHQYEWDLINCGVIGGTYNNMLLFVNEFCNIEASMDAPKVISDMFITNYLCRNQFADKKILIGEPVTSKFKQYENDRKDVYFIHK